MQDNVEVEGTTPTQAVPQEHKRYRGGTTLLIAITALLIALFTAGIAYSVQTITQGAQVAEGVLVDGVREFRIRAQQWDFNPATIKVQPGETVRFIVTTQDIMHGFAINELGINLPLSPGAQVEQEVTIPQDMPEGTYTMYCSIFCGIGHPYMKGTIIVGTPGLEPGKFLPYMATIALVGIFGIFVIVGRHRTP